MSAPSPDRAGTSARRRVMREVLLVTDRLHKALWHAVADQVAQEGLSVVQWLILSDIGSDRGGTLTDYARWLSRDPGALSRAIHDLTERGLLCGVRASGDRRRVKLDLTPAGECLRNHVSPRLDRLASALEEGFGHLPLEDLLARMTRAEKGVRTRPGAQLRREPERRFRTSRD